MNKILTKKEMEDWVGEAWQLAQRQAWGGEKNENERAFPSKGERMTKQQKLTALRKELMKAYEYMRCGNLEEFKQRLQWLSEGMLKNHITGSGHQPNVQEIALYQKYRERRTSV